MVLVEIRHGRLLDLRLELGRRIVDICAEVLGVPKRTVFVEFTVHAGDEMLRDGDWAGEWTAAEASAGEPKAFVQAAATRWNRAVRDGADPGAPGGGGAPVGVHA